MKEVFPEGIFALTMSKPRRKFSERPSKTFTNVDGQVFKVFGQTVLVTCKIGKDFSVAQFKMPDNGKIMVSISLIIGRTESSVL